MWLRLGSPAIVVAVKATDRKDHDMQSISKLTAMAAMAIGLGAGSYGIASAASGSSAATTTTTPAQTAPAPRSHDGGPRGWGGQRSDETLLTGDTAAKVKAAAVAKVGSGATVDRVETDADGNAKYEVHYTAADGSFGTVYVDASYGVVSVETR
jgi:hypothetical protein